MSLIKTPGAHSALALLKSTKLGLIDLIWVKIQQAGCWFLMSIKSSFIKQNPTTNALVVIGPSQTRTKKFVWTGGWKNLLSTTYLSGLRSSIIHRVEKGWKYLTVECRRALHNVVWGGQRWAEGQHRSSATETQEALRERTKGRAGASGGMNNQIQLLSGAVY